MPNMKTLALTVWYKKIFKVFSFGCHGNQSSSWNSNLWSFLKVHHPRIISVKFHWNLLVGFWEDLLSNCSWTDGHTDGRTDGRTDAGHWSITIAHPEHLVFRWAKTPRILVLKKSPFSSQKTTNLTPNEIADKWKSTKFQADDFMWNHSIIECELIPKRFLQL